MIRPLFILTCATIYLFTPATGDSCFKCNPLPVYAKLTVAGNSDKELICNATMVLKYCATRLNNENCEKEKDVLVEAWTSISDHYSCTGSSISPSFAIYASVMIINTILYTCRKYA